MAAEAQNKTKAEKVVREFPTTDSVVVIGNGKGAMQAGKEYKLSNVQAKNLFTRGFCTLK